MPTHECSLARWRPKTRVNSGATMSLVKYLRKKGAGENAYSTALDQQVAGMPRKHLKPGHRIAFAWEFLCSELRGRQTVKWCSP